MIKRALKISLVLVLIAVLNAFNIATIGNIAIAAVEELENQTKTTNIANIELDAFYKNGENKTHSKQLDIQSEETLYLQLRVKDKVSISSAKIKIENSNFKILKDKVKESNYIQNIDENANEIEISPISSNNEAILEIPIQFKKESEFTEDYFAKEQTIKLEGIYKDENQKEKELTGEIKIHTEWVKNVEITLNQNVNKYFSLGEEGVIISQKIDTEVKDNVLPRKKETIEINVPVIDNEKPEGLTVLVNGEEIEAEKLKYDKENNLVTIENENQPNQDGKLQWKNSKNEYIAIYKYNNKIGTVDRTLKIKARSTTTMYGTGEEKVQENEQEQQITKMGNVATVETSLTGEIYKGYMYAGSNKEINYVESNKIEVSYIDSIENLVLNTNNENLKNNEGQEELVTNSTVYKNTIVNKEEMKSILGENGIITIKNENGEVISEINKDTQVDENGNISIAYPDANNYVTIETTKPEKEGTLTIKNIKAIKGQTGFDANYLKQFNKLLTKAEIKTNVSTEIGAGEIELKEPATEIKTEINKDSLSTLKTNKDVEIKVTLKSNSEKYDLYKNPIIDVVLPSDVTNVEVNSINTLYGEEFTMQAQKGIIDGKQAIKIKLNGEQTEYKDIGIEGTTIVINANLTLNNTATSKEDGILTRYMNEKATSYKDENGEQVTKINIVTPKGLITTNNIETLGIETIGEDKIVSQELERNSAEKSIEVKSEIINNNENPIQDIKILGEFGTNGKTEINGEEKENNVDEELKTALQISATDTNKIKVYYTENEKATNELEKAENAWKEEITDASKTRKYLITVTDMQPSEKIETSYQAKIGGNLEYNQQSYQGYMTTYTESNTGTEKMVEATDIELTTGAGPVLEAELSASVGGKQLNNNDEVKRGETIKYTVTLKNTGSEDVTNAKIIATIPEGTVLLNDDDPTIEEEAKVKEITVENIKVGETIKENYDVRVKNDAQAGSEIKQKVKLTYGDVEKESNELVNIVNENNAVTLSIRGEQGHSDIKDEGTTSQIYINVTNNTNQILENVNIQLILPDEYTLGLQEVVQESGIQIDPNNVEFNKEEKTILIKQLAAGQTIKIVSFSTVGNIDENEKEVSIYCKTTINGIEYRSNEYLNTIRGTDNFEIKQTATKENEYVEAGEYIEYTIRIVNNNEKIWAFNVHDKIPAELTITEISVNGEKGDINELVKEGNEVHIYSTSIGDNKYELNKGEEIIVKIKALVNAQTSIEENYRIVNQAILYTSYEKEVKSNEVYHLLSRWEEENPGGEDEKPGGNDDESENNNISGLTWIDANSNGIRDDGETLLQGVKVYLIDSSTNSIAKNVNGAEITSVTDSTGFYGLTGVQNGNYVVAFEYDTTQYYLTTYKKEGADDSRISKAIQKEMNINGQNRTLGVTDAISINSNDIGNINAGFIKAQKFDMNLDKYINRITVKEGNVTKAYQYNNQNFAKVELDLNKHKTANIIIEYELRVTNIGELEGYVNNIVDYLPSDVTVSSEMNKDWYKDGNNIYNSSLANQKIAAGESKSVNLIITKEVNGNNTGTITNIGEIAESYNEFGLQDINSTPNNKVQGENDMGMADVVIGIKTGKAITYIVLVILATAVIGLGIYYIKKKVITTK